LPRLRTSAVTSAVVCGEVSTVETTSTSFITGAGAKKCRPSTRSGRAVSAASRVTDSALVPVARIAPGLTSRSRAVKTSRLTS
jgi:hypothetical protein